MAIERGNNLETRVINLDGPEGNAFMLMGLAQRMSRQLGFDGEKVVDEMKSGDYANLVKVFDNYFGSLITLTTEQEDLLEQLGVEQ